METRVAAFAWGSQPLVAWQGGSWRHRETSLSIFPSSNLLLMPSTGCISEAKGQGNLLMQPRGPVSWDTEQGAEVCTTGWGAQTEDIQHSWDVGSNN